MAALSQHRAAGSRGFTLVELLVVIVIIGILAGLLVPAISRGIGEADRTACRSNLQQLHKLGILYSASRKGRWPSAQGGALWVSFSEIQPPLIDPEQLDLLFCPLTDTEHAPGMTDFLGPVSSFGRLRDSEPLAADKEDNHGDRKGGNVLRKDGSVQPYGPDDPVWEVVREKLKP